MVEVIRLVGWTPRNVCVSSSDNLLVIMNSDDYQTRVVRYYGSKEGQIIQLNQQGSPLYSSGNLKYISENRNLDICVADWEAGSVVVVDQACRETPVYLHRSFFNCQEIELFSSSWHHDRQPRSNPYNSQLLYPHHR